MHLGMRITMRQDVLCAICACPMDDHDGACPQGALEKLFDRVKYWRCPGCLKKNLMLNVDDAFECGDCATVWVGGLGRGDPPAGARIETLFDLDADMGEMHMVYLSPEKGRGVFKHTATAKMLTQMIKAARAEVRRPPPQRKEETPVIQSYLTVNPRFTPGSPAQVRQEIAERVAKGEKAAIEYCRDGIMGGDLADKAARLGLANIVLFVAEHANRWVICDQLTGEVWERMKKYKKGARVEVWDERCGWVSAKVERLDGDHTIEVCRDDQHPWEKHAVNRLGHLRLKSSVKQQEAAW